MAYVAKGKYTFNPDSSGSWIDFSGWEGFNPRWLKAIINQTRNVMVYVPGLTGIGGTFDGAGKVLTLDYNTSTHSASDILLFQYDDQEDVLRKTLEASNEQNAKIEALIKELILVTKVNTLLAHEISMEALKDVYAGLKPAFEE